MHSGGTGKNRNRSIYEKAITQKRRFLQDRLVTLPIDAYFRQKDVIPFHIPHRRIFHYEDTKIERKTETIKQIYLPNVSSDSKKGQIVTVEEMRNLYKHKSDDNENDKSQKKDPDAHFGRIFKLPPLAKKKKKKEEIVKVKLIYPSLQGKVDFQHLLDIFMKDKTNTFLYMRPTFSKRLPQYSPYEFTIIDANEVNPKNFYTVCRDGIIHFQRGEMVFDPIKQLYKSYMQYQFMANTEFFKHFLSFKIFTQWKRFVRTQRFELRKLQIRTVFLYSQFDLRRALCRVQRICNSLSGLSFFDDSHIEKLTLQEFIKVQIRWNGEVKKKLLEFRSSIQHVLREAFEAHLNESGFTKSDRDRRVPSQMKGTSLDLFNSFAVNGYLMAKDDVVNKIGVCQVLCRSLKLVDYMMQHALHRLLINSMQHILRVFKKHTSYLQSKEIYAGTEVHESTAKERTSIPKFAMFKIDLKPDRYLLKLIFEPNPEEWVNCLKTVLNLWRKTVEAIDPLLEDTIFYPFTRPLVSGIQLPSFVGIPSELPDVLECDFFLQDLDDYVVQVLHRNIDAVHVYMERFQDTAQFYKFNVKTDPKVILKERDQEKFKFWLSDYSNKLNILTSLIPEEQIGLFCLAMEDYMILSIPVANKMFKIIHATIPRIARQRSEELMKETLNAIDLFARDPKTPQNYVDYLELIDKYMIRVDELEASSDYIRDLYEMSEDYEVAVPADDIEFYYDFIDKLSILHHTLETLLLNKEKMIEDFNRQLEKDETDLMMRVFVLKKEIEDPALLDPKADPVDIEFALQELNERVQEEARLANIYKACQRSCKVEVGRFEYVDETVNQLQLRLLLWENVSQWDDQLYEWLHCDFETLNAEEMQQAIAKYLKNILQFEKHFPPNKIVPILRQKVERMRDKIPFINNLRNPNIKPRHWLKLEQILNYKFPPDEIKTLRLLEEKGIYYHPDDITDLSAQASSESGLELLLKKVEDAWKTLEFTCSLHKDSKDMYILTALDEINTVLDETHINLSTIASSRNVGPIKPRVDEWMRKVDLFSKTMEEWMTCQTNWLYLEPIFSAPDIQRQLPNEAQLFNVVDKSWKLVMQNVAKNPLAMQAATMPGLIEELEKNNKLLEEILKCLEAYLESKRVIFPRFYFLSNEELLEILAQTRNPHAVQPHLRKCFDAIAKLNFGWKVTLSDNSNVSPENVDVDHLPEGATKKMTTDIIAMVSPEGEAIDLTKGLKARGNVEDWLGKVESAMFFSLFRLAKSAIDDYIEKERTDWVLCHASQVIITVSQIMWARDVHTVLDSTNSTREEILTSMRSFEQKCFKDLNDAASMVRGNLTKIHRSTLCALITIDVHARDGITALVTEKVSTSTSFEWNKQLRYYWDKEVDNCIACMASARHVYGYEYLGVSPRLVITPLTDKCYLCLMGALQLDLGGAPAGPAGTGKTETTKDLAKALAIQCVVFNCSEGLDYKMMGRFFSGLAQSGAWCCFDEFNRIDIEVLSVIAQQLITIRNAKAAKQTRFMFEGREIRLVGQCATFITMNPGYAGRTELPDNLKSVFRPFAMMVPDYGLIAEVILYSEGFESSKNLAQKMVNMYKLCSEQLSQQDHYDFGMRAVKSVLVMAGSLKRENPDKREDIVLIRALRDSNLPKFLADDAVLFKGILNDLFPGVVLPEHDYGSFQKAMEVVVEGKGLQPVPCTFTKTIQLYETMVVRHGVMTVGPTGSGKTTVLNVLKGTLAKLHEDNVEGPYFRPVTIYTLNPKSVTMGELYGEVNLATMEWKDGLLGIFVRTAVRCIEEVHQWVVCDGPVDAVWIENMNTVLDDNKMLCLANSERIKLTNWVHMVFEVQDLSQASPATVSRCGMVYVDPNELKWMPYVKTWGQNLVKTKVLTTDKYNTLLEIFETYFENGLEFVRKNCSIGIHTVEISKVAMCCSLLQSIFKAPKIWGKLDAASTRGVIIESFFFAYIWSVGGNIVEKSRDPFEELVRAQFDKVEELNLPYAKSIWEIFYSPNKKKLEPWTSVTTQFKFDSEVQFFDLLVPTTDTVCFGYIMQKLLEENHPVFFTGTTGVGKSVIAKGVLNAMTASNLWVVNILNFSAQTSSFRTQEMIELKMERKKRTLLGAPYGKRIALFVDDVNMPKLETYGAQAPIELLRQFLDFKGLYDREKLFWKRFDDMVLCCASAPPGGGRNPLTPRFVRHFGMLFIPAPSNTSLKVIFTSILKGFFMDFAKPILESADTIVWAAVELYERIAEDLLPTPAKSHYVFNLRDLSKCIQGVLQADGGTMRERNDMLRLFFHECLRVFHDRLIDLKDKTYFWFLLRDICVKYLGGPVVLLPPLSVEILKTQPLLFFGDFTNPSAEKQDRIYEEIRDVEKLKGALMEALIDFNLIKAQDMKLIFFMDAVEHICRLARILRAERGNGLLVGVGGMGKQSLTNLASHLNFCSCFQIELTRTYDYSSFHEDLRKLYFSAGGLNQDMTFLFTDTQIVMEEFLEDVNNILNSGEVPNLFEADELEKCIIACRPAAKQLGIAESNRDAIYDFFISRVRSRLHVVLCMSPVGDAFRRRCRMFPSLVNCCTIDWFMPWPQEALISVAQDALKEMVEPKLVKPMSEICYTMHSSVEQMTARYFNEMKRHYYVTPSSYLDLLKLYGNMLDSRKKFIFETRERINNGLMKLFETNDLVENMRGQLVKLEPLIASKNIEVSQLMEKLLVEKTAADEVRTVVLEDESLAKEKAGECQVLKDDAQADLDLALPAMEAAVKALEALNKNDINEVRVFIKPPHLVKFTMEAVCLLLGNKQDWASAKVVLGDGNFLKRLQEYDKNHIPDILLKKLKKYIEDPQFVPELVAQNSKACKSLCLWVKAIDKYAKVYRIVEPKRKKLLAAETELNAIMTILRAKQAKLADVEAQIAKLEETYDMNLKEKAKLEAELALCSARMNRAGRLTSALADEQERWEKGVKSLTGELHNLVGDVLVAAACVAYLGAFTSDYREELCKLWLRETKHYKIPASHIFDLIHILADAYEIRIWNSCGLPTDKVSIENGIYVTRASRWPLLIDPQEQANRWIKSMESDNNLKMCKMTDANFMRTLESCIRLGFPMLIWEVGESLDPTLRPVLTKSVVFQGGRYLIRLGDSDVEYDKNFRLYVTTKLSNPHYLPEICIQVTLVNFTVTPKGLEDQLLGDVVRLERPDLEKQRTELIIRINKDKGQLIAIEDKILKMLFASKGNILDDEELVETLNESKETSAVISARLEETEETEAKMTVAREGYRSVAERGSVLYFVVASLAEIDPMYQFSLRYFNMVFNNIIETTPPVAEVSERLDILKKEITLAVYNNVSRGLFERHKLVYSFMLCASILLKAGTIKESHWIFLLRGPVGTTEGYAKKPNIPGLTDWTWNTCLYLEELDPTFKNLSLSIPHKISVTIGDYTLEIALGGRRSITSPFNWNQHLDLFKRLMLIKALKEEKVVFGITEYVKTVLGQAFIESPLVSLHSLYADTTNITPLVFVLSTGCDPVGAFLRFAAETNNTDKINSTSLGQGQGPIAERMIEKGKRRGDWIFLQNCHLASSWMLKMEKVIMDIAENPSTVHQEFRLFMSSMPSKTFPVSVLQNSVKVTNEPPKGLRANVKRAFSELQEDFFSDHPLGKSWRKMIFGICFFHAIILERKKFGPLGWNIMYEFNDSDRECALLNLNLFCAREKDSLIPWNALQYITGEITYGGRVTDFWDQRTLKTVLKKFFAPVTLVTGYKYSESGTYYCPESQQIQTLKLYQDFIEKLPIIEEPEIFGMHENANIAFQTKETGAVVNTIREVCIKEAAGAEGKSSDEIVFDLADNVKKRISKKIDPDSMNKKHLIIDEKGRVPSLTTVLLQEVDRFNKMLNVIHTSIDNLKKAIKGFIVMSDDLEEVYRAFISNLVPKMWSAKSYPSLKSLGSWIRDLEIRIDFVSMWVVQEGPPSFWISGFFFPQGFMTGVLQTHARKYDFPIDQLKVDFAVKPIVINQEDVYNYHMTNKKDHKEAYNNVTVPSDGILVHGLFLDAARFDTETMLLADPYPGELNPPLPVLHLVPTSSTPSPKNRYESPLYKTSVRAGVLSTTGHSTNFVIAVLLPTKEEQSYWIMKGTALLTQITD